MSDKETERMRQRKEGTNGREKDLGTLKIRAHPRFYESVRLVRIQNDLVSVDVVGDDFQDSERDSTEGKLVLPLEEIEDEVEEFGGEGEERGRKSSSDDGRREDPVILLRKEKKTKDESQLIGCVRLEEDREKERRGREATNERPQPASFLSFNAVLR